MVVDNEDRDSVEDSPEVDRTYSLETMNRESESLIVLKMDEGNGGEQSTDVEPVSNDGSDLGSKYQK